MVSISGSREHGKPGEKIIFGCIRGRGRGGNIGLIIYLFITFLSAQGREFKKKRKKAKKWRKKGKEKFSFKLLCTFC